MIIHPTDSIIRACALLLTPKGEFKEWLQVEGLNKKILSRDKDRLLNEEEIYNHSVTLLLPVFHGQEELTAFIDTHYDFIFKSLQLAWPFSLEAFHHSGSEQSPDELFRAAYYFYLVNFLEPDFYDGIKQSCSVTTIRPRKACLKWIHEAGIDELEDLAHDISRRFGVALLTPSFRSPQEEHRFREEHCRHLWEVGLGCYCPDDTLWPEERTNEKLLEWFHCETCYPVVDLTQMRLKNEK